LVIQKERDTIKNSHY